MTVQIKSWKVLRGMLVVAFHPRMIGMALWIVTRYSNVVFTSAYRPKKIHDKDSGIAATIPCRHLDIRSWIYKEPQKIVDDINEHWIYDPKRPHLTCAVLHDTGKGVHIHLQCHDRTKYLKEED